MFPETVSREETSSLFGETCFRELQRADRRSQSAYYYYYYILFDAYSRGDRGAATKVRVSWSGERVEHLIALLEERRQNKSLYHPTTPA